MSEFLRAFGLVIRDQRLRQGISQEGLAGLVGIHRTYVSSIETGKVSVGLDLAKKLADGLGVPLGRLISRAERFSADDEA